jgi:RES domain-containing protein
MIAAVPAAYEALRIAIGKKRHAQSVDDQQLMLEGVHDVMKGRPVDLTTPRPKLAHGDRIGNRQCASDQEHDNSNGEENCRQSAHASHCAEKCRVASFYAQQES